MKRSTPHNRIVAIAADPSTVDTCYKRGLELGRRGSWFEAHEAFEDAWRACAASERDFFQGLVHVVVAAYQHGRGKPVAAESQRRKALRRLAAYAPSHRGLDVAALLAFLERAEADPREHLVEGDHGEQHEREDDERGAGDLGLRSPTDGCGACRE